MADCLKGMMLSLMNWKLSTEIDSLEKRVITKLLGLKYSVGWDVSESIDQLSW